MDAPPKNLGKRRVCFCLTGFLFVLGVIYARFVFLEWTSGAAFRQNASSPRRRHRLVHASRGRILSSDGEVLAEERLVPIVAVQFRCLGTSPLGDTHRRLAGLLGVPSTEWNDRIGRIRARVKRIADSVNRRRRERIPTAAPSRIVVAEERMAHDVYAGASKEAVEQIAAHPERFRGVEIRYRPTRTYPQATLAAHVVGHLGEARKDELKADAALRQGDRLGREGVERRYEAVLRGHDGLVERTTDHKGRPLSEATQRPAVPGRDVRLTLDSDLQRTAEQLLDKALAQRDADQSSGERASGGGAIVVLDPATGAILASASAPRFDPNLFETGTAAAFGDLADSPDAPLFDRVARMQLPPGSVFKLVTAAALLEEGLVEANTPFECRGYLKDPGALRCAIFLEHGVGHGTINLRDALAQSCNVYFFHHVASLGEKSLAWWAGRFGLGQPTGVDLPAEASGSVANLKSLASLRLASVGQGPITATPLQIARMTAAIAGGGRLVTPHVVAPNPRDKEAAARLVPKPIFGLNSNTIGVLQDAMRMAVADPHGTAYAVLHDAAIPVSAKTGTAETPDGSSHAWIAAYFPADSPRYVIVVALEHAGDGADAAGRVVAELIERMKDEG